MKKLVSLFLLGTSSLFAQTTVVEIANFYCAHCQETNAKSQDLLKYFKKNNVDYELAPVYTKDNPSASLLYFSMGKKTQKQQDLVKNALFSMATVNTKAATAKQACIALNSYIDFSDTSPIGIKSLSQCEEMASSDYAKSRAYKTLKLFNLVYTKYMGDQKDTIKVKDKDAKIVNFPVFVIEKDNKISSVVSYQTDVDTMLEDVKDAVQ